MTGKITVGTIQDTAGNTVASTYVTNGVAKAWVNYEHSSSITVRDSLNQSSMTDFGVGYAFTNFTNQFSTLGYSQTASTHVIALHILVQLGVSILFGYVSGVCLYERRNITAFVWFSLGVQFHWPRGWACFAHMGFHHTAC